MNKRPPLAHRINLPSSGYVPAEENLQGPDHLRRVFARARKSPLVPPVVVRVADPRPWPAGQGESA